jgi:hypothetical protein
LLSRGGTRAKDNEIVSKADEPETGLYQSLIQNVEDNVGQERGDNPTLGSALIRGTRVILVIVDNLGCEKFAEDLQDVTISDILGHQVDDEFVRDVVEKVMDVGVNNPPVAILMGIKNGLDSLVSVATWAKAKGGLRESRFEDGFKEGTNHLLGHPVTDGGNAQSAQFALTLWDVDAEQGRGVVMTTMFEVIHEGSEVLFEISFEHNNRDPVHARSALVALDLLEGFAHARHINTAGEGVDLTTFLIRHTSRP